MNNWSIKKDKKSLWFYTPWFFFWFDFPAYHSSYSYERHDVLSNFHFGITFARISFEFSLQDADRTKEFSDFTCSILERMSDPNFEQELKEFDQYCKNKNNKKPDQSC